MDLSQVLIPAMLRMVVVLVLVLVLVLVMLSMVVVLMLVLVLVLILVLILVRIRWLDILRRRARLSPFSLKTVVLHVHQGMDSSFLGLHFARIQSVARAD